MYPTNKTNQSLHWREREREREGRLIYSILYLTQHYLFALHTPRTLSRSRPPSIFLLSSLPAFATSLPPRFVRSFTPPSSPSLSVSLVRIHSLSLPPPFPWICQTIVEALRNARPRVHASAREKESLCPDKLNLITSGKIFTRVLALSLSLPLSIEKPYRFTSEV